MAAFRFEARSVCAVKETGSMADAARVMCRDGLNALSVVDGGGRILGIITDRDFVATVAEGLDPEHFTVGEFIRNPPTGCSDHPPAETWIG